MSESDVERGTTLRIEDFDYELPKELVAQSPLERRDSARLLVVHRDTGRLEDRLFSDIVEYIKPGEVMVLNDTKVFPARLIGKKETGGKVEILLIGPAEGEARVWRVLLQPALREGQPILFEGAEERAAYKGRDLDGMALVEFSCEDVQGFARRFGRMPLPPYIQREPQGSDESDYQTVYAAREGAVAAPTAGLHFTPELLERIKAAGVRVCPVTLHVGYGTFKPVKDLETHRMHSEIFELSTDTADAVNQARSEGKRVWAIGTTSVRVLETCFLKGRVLAGEGDTDLFLYPPMRLEAVDGLVTNFHLPRSTLLMLVAAFMGREPMMRAYRHAIERGYRFYSYGDATLIL